MVYSLTQLKKHKLLTRMQQQYHRNHPWRLSPGGLYIPHSYQETPPDRLSWWDDVGFILNGRRVIVWWQHPRHVYAVAIEDQAWQEAGPGPQDDWLTEGLKKNDRRVGTSRKKLVSYTCREPSDEAQRHDQRIGTIRQRLTVEGIDMEVSPSWRLEQLKWATGISLVAPLEVRSETELAALAALARRLVRQETTLQKEFPGNSYARADWVRETAQRER